MADSNEPKKETVRITVSPAPKPQLRVDQVPTPLCWTLLGASATILILQIWNYLS
jgi:hypothetical protein